MGGLVGFELFIEHALVRRMHVDEDEALGALRKKCRCRAAAQAQCRVAAPPGRRRRKVAYTRRQHPRVAPPSRSQETAAPRPPRTAFAAQRRRQEEPLRSARFRRALLDRAEDKVMDLAAVAKAHLEL